MNEEYAVSTETQLLVEREAHAETIRQRDILAAALRTVRKQIADALRGQTFCLDDLSKGGIMDAERTVDSALREAGMAGNSRAKPVAEDTP